MKTKKIVSDNLKQSSIMLLQRIWRKKFKLLTTYRIIEHLFSIGLTIEKVKLMKFEPLVIFLREKSIISATKVCLLRIYQLCISRHGSSNIVILPENINVRIFLSSYMIAYYPQNVFENIGTLEKALLDATIPLLTRFQNICKTICSSAKHTFQDVPDELTKDFLTMLFEFYKNFKEWKVPDVAKLTSRIKHALTALYKAKEQIMLHEPDNSELKIEFNKQIERLRIKLRQVAGVNALEQFDVEQISGFEDELNTNKDETNSIKIDLSPKEKINNEQLAHELLLNPNFQFNDEDNSSEDSIIHRIKKSFNTVFWDSLKDDLKCSPPSYVRTLRILEEIRNGIIDVAGNKEEKNISEIIDIDFIKQQADANLYTWDNCQRLISSIVDVIQKIQSPQRDNETKAKWKLIKQEMVNAQNEAFIIEQPRALCNALEFVLNRINILRIDAANARLRLIAPVIKVHGIDYERGKFQCKLDSGTLTLERTQNWFSSNIRSEVASTEVSLEKLLEGKASAYIHVHSAAMLSLVSNQTIIIAEVCPETLLFDEHKLSMIQQEFNYIVSSITIIIKIKNIIPNNITNSQVLTNITEFLTSNTKSEINFEETILEINKFLKKSSLTPENHEKLFKNLKKSSEVEDAVNKLMTQRIKTVWKKLMKNETVSNDLNNNLNFAINAFIPRIEKVVAKLVLLTNLNRTVHLAIYNKIINEESLKLKEES
jgi:hypothetical protein